MSQPLTLARPYARAAFELASSNKALDDWAKKLAFASQAAADPQLRALFGNPRVGSSELASLFLPDGEPADSPFAGFIKLLADNQRLQALPEIAALFEEQKRDAEKVLQVRVRTASPIDATETARLKDALKRRFGRDIELEQAIDPSVIGGAVIDAGDVVIDGSVRGRLHQLEAALTH
ncbi:MAG TPA: F0F1 ATP synthase subunit delta [Rhodanobacteraceae bacterium]|nr:F0F1 ATP synthase subunit delta [Rhodanobacteraceae bacterium]